MHADGWALWHFKVDEWILRHFAVLDRKYAISRPPGKNYGIHKDALFFEIAMRIQSQMHLILRSAATRL